MTPLPRGLRIELDPKVRKYRRGAVLAGGSPLRIICLTDGGRTALTDLLAGRGDSRAARSLGRRLVDAGIAHPRPARAPAPATVVVPVRDRPCELERCLAAVGPGVPIVVVDDGSTDAAAIAATCRRHGARLVVQGQAEGPAAARNRALVEVHTELVAFLDSDCVPRPGWLEALAGHFTDPLLAAAAPRVRPLRSAATTTLDRFTAARSPLDMGTDACAVGPGRPVAYVPSAALVVRRAALTAAFDPALRYGEDVDLVWRLRAAGWRVRYDPTVVVEHAEPRRWRALLARRYRYGTSAPDLARRHPGRLAPAVLSPWPTLAAGLLLSRRPVPSLAVMAAHGSLLVRRSRRSGVPAHRAAAWTGEAVGATLLGLGRAGAKLAAPALLGVALWKPRARAPVAYLLAVPPLLEWAHRRPGLDPLRWTLACLADDAAYGAGVWSSSVRARTAAPLTPRLSPLAADASPAPVR